MRCVRLACFVLALLILGGPAPVRARTASPVVDSDAITAYVEAQMRRHRLPGVAVVVTRGEDVVYLEGFGSAGEGRPVTPQTPFYIGSVSKPVTALAVMQLADEGVIELDAPVQRYLPWFAVADPEVSCAITVRHLLQQTSGLSNAGYPPPLYPEGTTMETAVRDLRSANPVAPPGTRFHYFNPNYTVLGVLIEEVTAQSYAAYVHEHIFEPLEMVRSLAPQEPAGVEGLATGHNLFFGVSVPRQQPLFTHDLPAGFIISTAEDLAHFLMAQVRQGRYGEIAVLSADAVVEMHTPPAEVPSDYALGWVVTEQEGMRLVRHNGAVDTFYTDVILVPDEEIGIAVLTNQNGLLPLVLTYVPFADGLVDVVLGREPVPGPSVGLLAALVTGVVLADLARHGVVIARLSGWRERVKYKSRSRQLLSVAWQHLLVPAVVAVLVVMMLLAVGPHALRVTWLYLMPDIGLWLMVTVLLFLVEGIVKLSSIFGEARDTDRY